MIKSIQYTNLENVPSYYAAGVKSLTQFIKKPMEFKTGINVILGPNGIGKSTIIRDLAKYFYCYNTGIFELTDSAISEVYDHTLNKDWIYTERLKDGMTISSDGQVCYISSKRFNGNVDVCNRDYGNNMDGLAEAWNNFHSSSGQTNLRSLNHIWNLIKKLDFDTHRKKVITDYKQSNQYKDRHSGITEFYHIENPDLSPSVPTILMDELDANLDVVNTVYLFKAFEILSDRFQIIMSTHSPLLYYIKNVNVIELIPGYYKRCDEELHAFMKDHNLG